MNSIAFPDMFNSASTNLVYDKEATTQNLLLLLKSEKTSFFGDPYFGSTLKRLIFEQNNVVLRDLVIDTIYQVIATYIPQIKVTRKDITVNSDGATLYCNIKAKNMIDFNLENINLALFNIEELG